MFFTDSACKRFDSYDSCLSGEKACVRHIHSHAERAGLNSWGFPLKGPCHAESLARKSCQMG